MSWLQWHTPITKTPIHMFQAKILLEECLETLTLVCHERCVVHVIMLLKHFERKGPFGIRIYIHANYVQGLTW